MSIWHAYHNCSELNCCRLTAAVDNANISNAFERAWGCSTIYILTLSLLGQQTHESIPRLPVGLPHTLSPSLDRPLFVYMCACCRLCFTSPRKPHFSCRGQRFLLKVWTCALLGSHHRPSQGQLIEQGRVGLGQNVMSAVS